MMNRYSGERGARGKNNLQLAASKMQAARGKRLTAVLKQAYSKWLTAICRPFTAGLAALAAMIMLGACGKGDISKSSQVLARVGDREITTAYYDRQIANFPESVQKLSTHEEGKKAILDGFVN